MKMNYNKGKNNPNYKHGKYCKKYYCKICNKEISYITGIFGLGYCKQCGSGGKGKKKPGTSKALKGRKRPDISKRMKGKQFMLGKHHTKENKNKIRKSLIGKTKNTIRSEETKKKISLNHADVSGKNNPNFKDGRTLLCKTIRNVIRYKNWINEVFKRDNYICQECGQIGGKLEAHHKKPFAELLQEFLKEYDQFSPIEDKETLVRLAIKWQPFWDINNGKTLCEKCHKKIKKGQRNERKIG